VKPLCPFDEEWDYLVVLDACRYDTFAEVYDGYLSGHLEPRRSAGSATPEWAAKTLTGRYDARYYSANPFINSLGVPLNEVGWGASCGYEWSAADHLAEVVDLWHDAWVDDLGTVPPGAVTRAVRARDDHVDRDHDRVVIHYMQPHAPFLRRGRGRKLRRVRDGIRAPAGGGPLDCVVTPLRRRIEGALDGNSLVGMVGMWADLDLRGLLDVLAGGTAVTLRRYYEENLRLALEAVVDLVADLDGTVVVTADHGEAFGEEGVWEHHVETHIPPLVEVPWLVLDR